MGFAPIRGGSRTGRDPGLCCYRGQGTLSPILLAPSVFIKQREQHSKLRSMITKPIKKLMLLTAFLCFSMTTWGQLSVSGTVSDANGPLPGANIAIKGTSIGTQTDFNGNYTLDNVD